jgi:hypothetical protein
MMRTYWLAEAEYADGTTIERWFPYNEGGNPIAENDRQYDIECWLLEQHPDCTWMSVIVCDRF